MARDTISPEQAEEKARIRRERERLRMRLRRAQNPGVERPSRKRYRERNKQKIKEYAARKYAAEKDAQNEKSKIYYAKNREVLVAKAHARKAADPEGVRIRLRDWHTANRERRLAAARVRDALPQNKAKRKAYYLANAQLWRIYAANRRAKKKSADGRITAADIQWLMGKQRGRCAECGISIRRGYHADHIIPLKLGGSNRRSNYQLLCAPCNLKKAAKHPIAFARERGRLL